MLTIIKRIFARRDAGREARDQLAETQLQILEAHAAAEQINYHLAMLQERERRLLEMTHPGTVHFGPTDEAGLPMLVGVGDE